MRKFIVALSGGLDSVVLLHLCKRFFGQDAVLAVHVNHHLQSASGSFEAFCQALCESWSISLEVAHLNGKPTKGQSIEAWARMGRYEALGRVAERTACQHIFTAHHQDDQIETLLIALSRGAGLAGLAGIAPSRALENSSSSLHRPLLHRPLLACSRAEILAYAQEEGLSWIEDPSNTEETFLRNRIRRQVLPALKAALPEFGATLQRSLGHLAQTNRLLEGSANDSEQALFELRTQIKALGLAPPSQARLAQMGSQLLGQGAKPPKTGASVLHEGYLFERTKSGVQVRKQELQGRSAEPALGAEAKAKMQPGWQLRHPNFQGQFLLTLKAHKNSEVSNAHEVPVLEDFSVQPQRGGLRMKPAANRPHRSLKNLYQEAGILSAQRQYWPCLLWGGEVVFAPGLPSAELCPWLVQWLPDNGW